MRNIPNVPGYAADTRGQIWSLQPGQGARWKKPHRVSPWTDPDGYQHVSLRPGGRRKRYAVHLLVAAAFIGPRPRGLVCSHRNGRPSDNRPSNLRYCTQAQNIADKVPHGTYLCGDRHHLAKATDDECRAMLRLLKKGNHSAREISLMFGRHEAFVSSLARGRFRKHLFDSPTNRKRVPDP